MAKINPALQTVNTHRVYLPSTFNEENEDDRVWLEIKDSLLLSDKLNNIVGRDAGERVVNGLASAIVAWNYTEDGTPDSPMIPITEAIINAQITEPEDVKLLFEEYQKTVEATKGLSTEQKKTSLDTTPPSPEASPIQI